MKTPEYRINSEIYTAYAWADGMFLHRNRRFTMKKKHFIVLLFVIVQPSMPINNCKSIYEIDLTVKFLYPVFHVRLERGIVTLN